MFMRLFIAVDFNELKDYFAGLQGLLPKNSKLSMARTFHLTLKFLGDVQPNGVDEIKGILKNIKHSGFSVSLGTIGVFPSEGYVRVVWVGIKPEDDILGLQENIDESLRELFKKEKSFRAHITLARVKFVEDEKSFAKNLKKIKVENKKIEIKDFRLIKSTLTPKGPIYEDLGVFDFA